MSKRDFVGRAFVMIYIGLMLAGLAIVAKMFYIVFTEQELAQYVGNFAYRHETLPAKRGNILSHDGRLLVTSISKYRLYTDLRAQGLKQDYFEEQADTVAQALSQLLGEKSKAAYLKEWKADRKAALSDPNKKTMRYRPLTAKEVDYVTLKKLKEVPVLKHNPNRGGLISVERITRIYPHDMMAAYTLGWINEKGQGVGIEHTYNTELAGTPGEEVLQRTTANMWIPVNSTPKLEPQDGTDVVTTIDIDLQEMVEGAVKAKLLQHPDLEWGTAVLMDVKTGEVRAIANKRKVVPGNYIVEDENYALRYRKDPGSTFKLASFMVMLEKGLQLTDTVNTGNGSIVRYNKKFEDEGSQGGMLSVQQVFEKSSNVGTILLSSRIYKNKANERDFAQRIEALRLKDLVKYDINPQQNVSPLIKPADSYSGLTLSMMSIGYELEITPLQTLALYNAVANGGVMVHPRFIKELRREGRVERRFTTQVVHSSICSNATLAKLHNMLVGVVQNGTAKTARSSEFAIAGKTGTAHVALGKQGYTNQKLSSFVGYFPAESPRYSCIVVFKTFDTRNKSYGGAIAAPVFKAIAERVYARSLDWHQPVGQPLPVLEAPATKNGNAAELGKVLQWLQVQTEEHSASSPWVTTKVQGAKIALKVANVSGAVLPNVLGMGMKDAIYLLENRGLTVKFSGYGTIKGQHPQPGSPYRLGDVVTLTLTND